MKKSRFLTAVLLLAVLASAFGLSAGTFFGRGSSWTQVTQVLAGPGFTAGLRKDGTVLYAGKNSDSAQVRALKDWKDVIRLELDSNGSYLVGYTDRGQILLLPLEEDLCTWSQADVSGWTDIQKIVLRYDVAAGLRRDGTMVLKAEDPGAYRVSDWKNIKDFCFFHDALVGLKTDGSIEATDYDWLALSGTARSDWKDLVQLIPYYGLMGLRADGQVIGRDNLGEMRGSRTGVKEIYSASDSIFYLRSDGTVAANLGYPDNPAVAEIESWRNIVALGFEDSYYMRYLPVGLCADGTVKVVAKDEIGEPYGQWDVEGWTNVKQIYSGADYTVGLCYDGTLLATGGEFGTADFVSQLAGWKDIEALSFENRYIDGHVAGLRKDGTVLAAGNNEDGQCDLK